MLLFPHYGQCSPSAIDHIPLSHTGGYVIALHPSHSVQCPHCVQCPVSGVQVPLSLVSTLGTLVGGPIPGTRDPRDPTLRICPLDLPNNCRDGHGISGDHNASLQCLNSPRELFESLARHEILFQTKSKRTTYNMEPSLSILSRY